MNIRSDFTNNNNFKCVANVFHHLHSNLREEFESNYLNLRSKEGRVYEDKVVARLPEINGAEFDSSEEWKTRRDSLKRIQTYLNSKGVKICLEVGCGNGWLSNAIADAQRQVIGIDVNKFELEQAAKLFSANRNITFIYGDIFSVDFSPIKFDAIVLSASVQYFSDVNKLINSLNLQLTDCGEIHIIDTPIYLSSTGAVAAKSRSENYFSKMENEEMSNYYFHHTYENLVDFKYEIHYNPKSMWSKVKRKLLRIGLSVFPWIIIKRF